MFFSKSPSALDFWHKMTTKHICQFLHETSEVTTAASIIAVRYSDGAIFWASLSPRSKFQAFLGLYHLVVGGLSCLARCRVWFLMGEIRPHFSKLFLEATGGSLFLQGKSSFLWFSLILGSFFPHCAAQARGGKKQTGRTLGLYMSQCISAYF